MLRTVFGCRALLAAVFACTAYTGLAARADRPVPEGLHCDSDTVVTRHLARIDGADGDSFQCLGALFDGDRVKAIRVETHRFTSDDGPQVSEGVKVEDFPNAVLESARGAVLDGIPGHDAIILHRRMPASAGRVELETSYLYNGLTGEYRSCRIALERAPGVGWRLVDSLEHVISHIVVRTRQIPLIGMFGISTLEGACT